ncbi:MAG: glycosyltransferase family 2 protein [Gemmatimonadota bacterium]|nr:glycosyltransferase family 2 protein [Gemmatimonadota bacterium]
MSDVTAVVLTIGEWFTPRALASLTSQTLPPHDVIVIENVSPFHCALNEAARRVTTPFFVQVDADMMLDPTCIEALRAAVLDNTGLVVAELRDPLLGQVVGIKLFRTACFRSEGYRDTISPDTDFVEALDRAGWKTLFIGHRKGEPTAATHTYGEHRPDYTAAYTYRKFLLEGRRCWYRGARGALAWRFERLSQVARNTPELARIAEVAQVAAAIGFFLQTERDGLAPLADDPQQAEVVELLQSSQRCDGITDGLLPLYRYSRLRDVFHQFTGAGRAIRAAGGGATFRDTLAALPPARHDQRSLVARVALCYGMFSPAEGALSISAAERALRSFATLGIGRRAGPREYLPARATWLVATVRGQGASLRW